MNRLVGDLWLTAEGKNLSKAAREGSNACVRMNELLNEISLFIAFRQMQVSNAYY